MPTVVKRVFGVALIVAGVVLVAFFPDIEFLWFKGRPFGFVLTVLGVLDLLESFRRTKPRGIVEELRGDFGLESSGGRKRDEEEGKRDRDSRDG
ncbi:DUF202 domain-containing protein [Streptomyces angustmyceticus]|uniref:Uncharacterized protein n=1 Tax=Streptomyces angustmyceticus TaxID=285578 RepID=A0A5J4LHT5_9ACTN|nr:DUF202 domain-containing protein [Streptomyces angustmyceticus]UAL66009.1 DUF202 domain-containing protein [Streptomyces angustmyceticus]GES33663.1 hypothetical protein San01_61510 [Streptomyces angustmyceticus]